MSRLHWFRRQAQLVRLCSGRGMTFRFCSRRPVRTYRPSLNSGINAALCIAKRLQYYAFRVSLVPSPWPLRSLRLKINRWKVRDGEDTIASTRDARAPQNLRTATATGECLDTARSTSPAPRRANRAGWLAATGLARTHDAVRTIGDSRMATAPANKSPWALPNANGDR